MEDIKIAGKRNPAVEAQILAAMSQSDGLQSVDIKTEAKEIAPILSGGTTVTTQKADAKSDVSSAVKTGSPVLDAPDTSMAALADLEKLIAELTLENQEKQAQESEKRIKSLLGQMQKQHKQALDKISESIAKSEEAAKAQKRNRIFGWIMTALSVLTTVITCVATFGAATPLAIAACAFTVAGLALNLTNQILTETGAAQKHIEKRADEMRKKDPNLTHDEAMAKAQNEWNLGWGIAQGICAIGAIACGLTSTFSAAGKKALEEATKRLSANVTKVIQAVGIGAQALNAGGSIASMSFAWDDYKRIKELAEKQAAVKEVQQLLDKINEKLEEEEATLKELLMKMQDSLDGLAEILDAPTQTSHRIIDQFARTV